ncbi:MAG: FTR1 family protein [Dongiaceae bacterium]
MLATLLIVFREVIEAGLIAGIVLAATRSVPHRGRWVAYGVGAGLVGAALLALFAGRLASLFEGSGQELFNAAVLLLAVGMLAWHNIWMAGHARTMSQELRAVGAAVASGRRSLLALAGVVGLAVLREGSEVVLFLYGIAASGGASSAALLLGGLLGLAAGAATSALMYFGLLTIPARRLFAVTSGLITLLAAGLAAQAVGFLQQAGYLEQLAQTWWDTGWILSEKSLLGRLLHTLIGYTANPSGAQVVAYLLTLAAIIGLMRTVQGRQAVAGKGLQKA